MASAGLTQKQRLDQWEAWMRQIPRARRRQSERNRRTRLRTQITGATRTTLDLPRRFFTTRH
jgi:hypothetical protein